MEQSWTHIQRLYKHLHRSGSKQPIIMFSHRYRLFYFYVAYAILFNPLTLITSGNILKVWLLIGCQFIFVSGIASYGIFWTENFFPTEMEEKILPRVVFFFFLFQKKKVFHMLHMDFFLISCNFCCGGFSCNWFERFNEKKFKKLFRSVAAGSALPMPSLSLFVFMHFYFMAHFVFMHFYFMPCSGDLSGTFVLYPHVYAFRFMLRVWIAFAFRFMSRHTPSSLQAFFGRP